MHSKAPEMRGRQKVARPPSYRIQNEYNPEAMPQYFQISVHILEGQKYAWVNAQSANSYVIVVLGKQKRRTSIRRNMEEPYYRENFVFELYTSERSLQQTSIWLAVMEPRCCAPPRVLGEATIDLGTIWAQPHHQVFHKWAQLCVPRHSATGPVGFLKVDISIIIRGEIQVMPVALGDEKLEENLLLPTGSEQLCANYLITVYGALGLPNGIQCQGDKRYGKAPTTFVRVTFCGLVAKTGVQHRTNNPMYCEQISIVEMFPNINQVIRLEVCSTETYSNKILASTHLNLADISHDGDNGFLPTFGPSLIHMYASACVGSTGVCGEEGPFYRGAILVALNTVVPYYQQGFRTITVEPVAAIRPDNQWVLEDLCIFCPLLEVSMLDRKVAGKLCGVAITIGEITSGGKSDDEFLAIVEEIKSRKLHYTGCSSVTKTQPAYGYLDYNDDLPVLQLATRLPDFRYRIYRNNMLLRIVIDMESTVNKVERQLRNVDYTCSNELIDELNKTIKNAASRIIKFIDLHYCTPTSSCDYVMLHYSTELDQKQLTLQKDEIAKIHQSISKTIKSFSITKGSKQNSTCTSRKIVKLLLSETRNFVQSLRSLIYKRFEGWPDIVIWLLNGGSRVAYAKISSADILFSVTPDQCGNVCGQIQTVYLKPLKCPKHFNTSSTSCYCIAAKVELLFWMGLYKQRTAFEYCLPAGYKLIVKDSDIRIRTSSMMVQCSAFIHKAKIMNSFVNCNVTQFFVRVNTMNTVKDTMVKQKTLLPVWNQVLHICKMMSMTTERLVNSPPVVLVEIINKDYSGKSEVIGRFQIQPTVDVEQDPDFTPKLQWYDLYLGVEITGQVLMSVKIAQMAERLLKSTVYSPAGETFFSNGSKDLFSPEDNIIPLPSYLIPVSNSYKVDIYWWGLREINITRKPCVVLEIEELVVKSDVIDDKKSNCNFPNGRISQIFEAPLEAYCPYLHIKLYDSSTFGRTLFLGTNVVKNPNKYMMDWLPKNERDASLKRASIMCSEFVRVNQGMYIKKSSQLAREHDTDCGSKPARESRNNSVLKRTKWQRLFSSREPDEEEYTLLPMFAKKPSNKLATKLCTEQKDWWLRYLRSQDHMSSGGVGFGDFVIYDSELESQPQFHKLKDWCSTIKLYNGKKTGIREKDDQLFCGYLKAGLAIYKWPPPTNTIAVSTSGVELNKGFFNDHANNDPAKFLIRVYLVKAMNLKTKDFTGRSDPYVTLICGKKYFGDRNTYVPNTLNPIFGRMHEFRCNIPDDYLLTVCLYNYDPISLDELIGSTSIDLEDRIYSRHRARVGLTAEYSMNEPGKWRDYVKPSYILEELCLKNHISPPIFPDPTTVVVNGIEYKDGNHDVYFLTASERKENLCLSILHKWHTLPICGYHLVPEHVETRSLYNPDKPSIEQGKLQMWVDIFPLDTGVYIPPPVDITPRKIEDYELRLTIYSVREVGLSLNLSGKKTTDMYVKAWIGSTDQTQNTDVHYQCTTGNGHFNWRMLFHFQYQHAVKKLIRKEKGPFTEFEENAPPILIVQLMDNESLSPEDYLGTLMLDLNKMPQGMKRTQECTLDNLERSKKINLFSVRNVRAWWPLQTIDFNTGNSLMAGIIKMELSLLPREKALLMPVGAGRDPPFPLPDPIRIEVLNEFCKKIGTSETCVGYRCFITVTALFAVIVLLLVLTIYFGLPAAVLEYWLLV